MQHFTICSPFCQGESALRHRRTRCPRGGAGIHACGKTWKVPLSLRRRPARSRRRSALENSAAERAKRKPVANVKCGKIPRYRKRCFPLANFSEMVSFIWSVADLLRGPYKPHQYGRVILPMTVLRRLDCVLEPTKQKVLEKHADIKGQPEEIVERILNRTAKQSFHNKSKLDFQKLKGDPDKVAANLGNYIKNFSSNIRRIFEYFEFEKEIAKMEEANVLYLVVRKFAETDLHPGSLTNHDMGLVFEDLIRRFNEASNETAGDHFTPRDVIRLMVDLLFEPDRDVLHKKGIIRTLYDPACGTGGMLSVAEEYLRDLNPDASLEVFGQDYNNEAFAICCSDMIIKGQDADNVKFGNSFTEDGHSGKRFDYLLANPPFGVKWEKEQASIEKEHDEKGMSGRFGAGLPRINDGAFLFLQHMISKMKPEGSRLAIVFNGSPLFAGDAGSGESEIRKWIIGNDWLEAIVALPDQMFYNTGISTYIWLVTNRKRKERRGKVQLVNANDLFRKMRRSLGNKRNELGPEHTAEIARIYGEFKQGELSKIFDNDDFGYRQITVERPLRLVFQVTPERIKSLTEASSFQNLVKTKKKGKEGEQQILTGERLQAQIVAMLEEMDPTRVYMRREEFERQLTESMHRFDVPATLRKAIMNAVAERNEAGEICLDAAGNAEADTELRDHENVPLKEDIHSYFDREVLPHLPDAWINDEKTRIGYEIPFSRHFYKYVRPRPLAKIQDEIRQIEQEILKSLAEVTG
jgi:type I restriction enzyme M protein